jgi:hypothetical protein
MFSRCFRPFKEFKNEKCTPFANTSHYNNDSVDPCETIRIARCCGRVTDQTDGVMVLQ